MHKPESVLENQTHKLLWDFEIKTDHLISTRRQDLIIIIKKREFAELYILQSRQITEKKLKESERKDKYLDLARELEKHESDTDTKCNWCSQYSHQKISTGTG